MKTLLTRNLCSQ